MRLAPEAARSSREKCALPFSCCGCCPSVGRPGVRLAVLVAHCGGVGGWGACGREWEAGGRLAAMGCQQQQQQHRAGSCATTSHVRHSAAECCCVGVPLRRLQCAPAPSFRSALGRDRCARPDRQSTAALLGLEGPHKQGRARTLTPLRTRACCSCAGAPVGAGCLEPASSGPGAAGGCLLPPLGQESAGGLPGVCD